MPGGCVQEQRTSIILPKNTAKFITVIAQQATCIDKRK
jgi:hypothetical protein